MSNPAAPLPDGEPSPPDADPVALRACLPPDLLAEFDDEWEHVLDQAKADKDLAGVHKLLHKWCHIAYAELRDPGSYSHLLTKAEHLWRPGRRTSRFSMYCN